MTSAAWITPTRIALVLALGLLLSFPLATILRRPDRLSALDSLTVDAPAYDSIANQLAETGSLAVIPQQQPPGFVFFLAAIYKVTGHSWLAARLALWLALTWCTGLAGWLAWRVHRTEEAAWTAALLTASAPALGAYVTTIQYEVLAALWLLVFMFAADWLARAHDSWTAVRRAVLIGMLAAAAALTRETLFAVIPLIAVYSAWRGRILLGSRGAAVGALVFLVVAGSPIVAWSAFQSARAGQTIAVSDKGSRVMAFGNNPRANGTYNDAAVGVGEPSGVAFIRTRRAEFLRLAGRKFLYFWGVLRDGWNVPRRSAIWLARALGGIVPLEFLLPLSRGGWILLALAASLAPWRSEWRQWWLIPGAIVATMSIHLLTISSHRFAVPILPLAFVVIAGPLSTLATGVLRSHGWRVAAAVAVAAVIVMQSNHWPMRYRMQAVALDGARVEDHADMSLGRPIRYAEASAGPRAALLLSDEFLPRGRFSLFLTYRVPSESTAANTPVARASIRTTEGTRACEGDILHRTNSPEQWQEYVQDCTLANDSIATLIVMNATLDVEFDRLELRWQ